MIEIDYNHKVRDILIHHTYIRDNLLYDNDNNFLLNYSPIEQISQIQLPNLPITPEEIVIYNDAVELDKSHQTTFINSINAFRQQISLIDTKLGFIANRLNLYAMSEILTEFNKHYSKFTEISYKLKNIENVNNTPNGWASSYYKANDYSEANKSYYFRTFENEIITLLEEFKLAYTEFLTYITLKNITSHNQDNIISLNSQVLVMLYVYRFFTPSKQTAIKQRLENLTQMLVLKLNSATAEIKEDFNLDINDLLSSAIFINYTNSNTVSSDVKQLEISLNKLWDKIKSLIINNISLGK